jgi:hypothetical protein
VAGDVLAYVRSFGHVSTSVPGVRSPQPGQPAPRQQDRAGPRMAGYPRARRLAAKCARGQPWQEALRIERGCDSDCPACARSLLPLG